MFTFDIFIMNVSEQKGLHNDWHHSCWRKFMKFQELLPCIQMSHSMTSNTGFRCIFKRIIKVSMKQKIDLVVDQEQDGMFSLKQSVESKYIDILFRTTFSNKIFRCQCRWFFPKIRFKWLSLNYEYHLWWAFVLAFYIIFAKWKISVIKYVVLWSFHLFR